MRGSGRGGGVGDPRNVSHPLCRFRVRRVRVMQKVYIKKSTPSFQPQLYQARLVKKSLICLLLLVYYFLPTNWILIYQNIPRKKCSKNLNYKTKVDKTILKFSRILSIYLSSKLRVGKHHTRDEETE